MLAGPASACLCAKVPISQRLDESDAAVVGRIVATMVHELRRNGGGLGLAAICSGGGQGDALLIEV